MIETKLKEMFIAFLNKDPEIFFDRKNFNKDFDKWLQTPQAKSLIGELGGVKAFEYIEQMDKHYSAQEWEYNVVEVEQPLTSDWQVNNKSKGGWELCGIVSRPLAYVYYFKRLKS